MNGNQSQSRWNMVKIQRLKNIIHPRNIMGGTSSKQTAEIERNKRLREFEEEIAEQMEEPNDLNESTNGTIPPLRDQYFAQFLNKDQENGRRKSSVVSVLSSSGSTISEVDEDEKKTDKEVEEAIAELEETFRSLTPPPEDLQRHPTSEKLYSKNENYLNNRTEGGPLLLPREGNRSQSCGTLNFTLYPTPIPMEANSKERKGTPMAIPQQGYIRKRPMGLGHLSKSSGGLINNGEGGSLAIFGNDNKGAALSAPPQAKREQPLWTPPKIDGFDVDKFREANKSRKEPKVSVRLPSTDDTRDDDPSLLKRPAPSYTSAELDLLRKLEKEVS